MLNFHPAIARTTSYVEFPRPVLVFRIQDSWDYEKLKVPLRDGDQVAGHSRQGVEIVIEGQIGQHSGQLKLTEPEMLATLQTLREALNVNANEEPYQLIMFADDQSPVFTFFKNCTTSRFEFDLSNQHLYSFAVSIHASDPVIHSGLLPG